MYISAVFNFEYKGYVQTQTLQPGRYLLECWGSQGAGKDHFPTINGQALDNGIGGRGGYSRGIVNLEDETKIFVYVGGQGTCTADGCNEGGFNGGGNTCASGAGEPACGGGGGTDIRIASDSLNSRIIVAGGGGGGGEDPGDPVGHGGGITGSSGNINFGSPGSQTDSGNVGSGGGFGHGASTCRNGGGAGSGWYGGNANQGQNNRCSSKVNDYDNEGGSGGSGYVFNESTYSIYPNPKPDKKYFLSESDTIPGNIPFLSPNGNPETGHYGPGYARITLLSDPIKYEMNNIIYRKFNSSNAYVYSYNTSICQNSYEIASIINGTQVVSISKDAFSNNSCITKITIPPSIIEINSKAFYNCTNLHSIQFMGFSKLNSIQNFAFASTQISQITLPPLIKNISPYAFAYCESLSTVYYCSGNAITTDNVFESSSQVKKIIVSNDYPSNTFSGLPVKIVESVCQVSVLIFIQNKRTFSCDGPRYHFLSMGFPIFESCP